MKPHCRSLAVASLVLGIVWQLNSRNMNAASKKRRYHSPLIHRPEFSVALSRNNCRSLYEDGST
jgi:hypothetical protein